MKITDLDSVKKIALTYLYLDVEVVPEFPLITTHPIIENVIFPMGKNSDFHLVNIMESKENLQVVRNLYENIFNKAEDVFSVFNRIRKQYKLTFLRDTKQYLSSKDFANLFREAWITSENPNDDVNVKIRTLVSWYKNSNKKYLMEEDDFNVYNNLEDEFTIYRGVGINRNPKGLSWTMNKEKAQWFANRFGIGGYIETAKINKKDVLAYFNSRGEEEIVADVYKLNISVL